MLTGQVYARRLAAGSAASASLLAVRNSRLLAEQMVERENAFAEVLGMILESLQDPLAKQGAESVLRFS